MSIQSHPSAGGRSSPHLTATTWHERVAAARTSQEVVDVARDFVSAFTPYELHTVPEPCRPSPKLFVEDIPHLAFDLMRHDCTNGQAAEAVQRLAAFFSQASARLAQLAAYEVRPGSWVA